MKQTSLVIGVIWCAIVVLCGIVTAIATLFFNVRTGIYLLDFIINNTHYHLAVWGMLTFPGVYLILYGKGIKI